MPGPATLPWKSQRTPAPDWRRGSPNCVQRSAAVAAPVKTDAAGTPRLLAVPSRRNGQQPAEAFETWHGVEYFQLHPQQEAVCATCSSMTCQCPHGIDIPTALVDLHRQMLDLEQRQLIASSPERTVRLGNRDYAAILLVRDIPAEIRRGQTAICRIHLGKCRQAGLVSRRRLESRRHVPGVFIDGWRTAEVRFRQEVYPGGRGHLVFEVTPPQEGAHLMLQLKLYPRYTPKAGFDLYQAEIDVVEPH